jgi:hypothetical protein
MKIYAKKSNCRMQLNEIEGKGKAYIFFQQQSRKILKNTHKHTKAD